jgi:flotillin
VIEQLPETLRAVAEGLQGANLTVLDSADGLNKMAASLAGRGLAILDAVRGGLSKASADDGTAPTRDTAPKAIDPAGAAAS